jgi:hypothetical protein
VENLVKNLPEKNANSEIWGLLALCTDFVQNKFTSLSKIISTVKSFNIVFAGFLPDSLKNAPIFILSLCKTLLNLFQGKS